MLNNSHEAYTGNTIGRREDVSLPKQFSPVSCIEQLATVLTSGKPERLNRNGKIHEGLPGSESVACSERSIRNLGDP